MSNIEEMLTIISNLNKDGIRFLVLFKILKSRSILEPKINSAFTETKLNKFCADIANRLLLFDKSHPSKDEIKQLLREIEDKIDKT